MTLSRFRARHGVTVLGPGDLSDFLELAGRNPVVNAFAEYRARSTNLESRLLAGEIWGRYDDGRLVAGCHVGANLVPVECTPEDARAFAERALTRPRSVVTIVGLQDQVWPLWDAVSDSWGPARETRWDQPHMEISAPPRVEPDPEVRAAIAQAAGMSKAGFYWHFASKEALFAAVVEPAGSFTSRAR